MKILVADDHVLFREGLESFLQNISPNVQVINAGNYGDAIKALQDNLDINLFITDLSMPDMGYEEGIAEIKQHITENTKLIVMSASEDILIVKKAFDLGVDGFIPKSLDPKIMQGAINLVINGGTYLPSDILQKYISIAPAQKGFNAREKGKLTARQIEVLRLVGKGFANKQIAYELDITESTVKLHLNSLMKTLNVTNRTQAVVEAQKLGLI